MRVALDTNVLVSAVAARGVCSDVVRVILAGHTLLVGATVLDEVARVLGQKLRVPPETVEELLALLRREGTVVDAPELLDLPLDAADATVVSEAVAGGADVLVTGDAEMLALAGAAPIEVLSPRAFWERLRELDDG